MESLEGKVGGEDWRSKGGADSWEENKRAAEGAIKRCVCVCGVFHVRRLMNVVQTSDMLLMNAIGNCCSPERRHGALDQTSPVQDFQQLT